MILLAVHGERNVWPIRFAVGTNVLRSVRRRTLGRERCRIVGWAITGPFCGHRENAIIQVFTPKFRVSRCIFGFVAILTRLHISVTDRKRKIVVSRRSSGAFLLGTVTF